MYASNEYVWEKEVFTWFIIGNHKRSMGMWGGTLLLPEIPVPLWHGDVVLDSDASIGQADFQIMMYLLVASVWEDTFLYGL